MSGVKLSIARGGPAPARGASAVALADVTITFHLADRAAYTAVSKASLTVADGEFVSIVGPTGCGKSTLLNVTAGLLAPSAGTASIFGAPLSGLNRASGYLFQQEALFPCIFIVGVASWFVHRPILLQPALISWMA